MAASHAAVRASFMMTRMYQNGSTPRRAPIHHSFWLAKAGYVERSLYHANSIAPQKTRRGAPQGR